MSEATRVAQSAGLELGQSTLKALLLGEYAKFPVHYRTYGKVRLTVPKPTGGFWHRDSIGRATRELARDGFLVLRRVLPGIVPLSAEYRTNGTTEKSVVWPALQVKNPLTRSQRRAARIKQDREMMAVERERRRKETAAEIAFLKRVVDGDAPTPEEPPKRLGADVSPAAYKPKGPTFEEELAAIANAAMAAQRERRRAQRDKRTADGRGAGPVPAPSPSAIGPPE